MLMLNLAIILLLILLNGFFAMAEIALVTARPGRLQPLADAGSKGAEAAIELKGDPSRLLATVQMGITIIAVLSGTFGQATLGEALQVYLAGVPAIAKYAHAISMAVVVIGISYLSLILGELVPKRVALASPERISAALARLMRGLARVGAPIEWLLSASTDLMLRLLPLHNEPSPVTDEEIGFMLRQGVATGHIAEAETAIVEGALRLGERRVSGVMTPRTQVEFLDLDDNEDELRRQIRESSYSRFPVLHGPTHQLAGIVQVKDLYDAALAGQKFDIRAALRPPLYIPDTVTVLRTLEMFKTSGEPMGLVVDEYGDLEGVTTLTDILEALVGEVSSGDDDPRVVKREDGTFLIDGMVGLDELKAVLDIARLPGEDADFHTLGGYLMGRLNRVPVVADRIAVGGFRFEIVEMDGRRVDRVLVVPVKGP
ncbi:MAG TPA: hemolysin family protein [Stellaceae bacterium]|jgi:putative hemolysin|nr:hemolysin family protein [Stellaceae bacterium]